MSTEKRQPRSLEELEPARDIAAAMVLVDGTFDLGGGERCTVPTWAIDAMRARLTHLIERERAKAFGAGQLSGRYEL